MKIVTNLINLPNLFRKILLIKLDVVLIIFSYIITYLIFYSKLDFFYLINEKIISLFSFILIAISIYYFTGQYRGITRYLGSVDFYLIIIKNFILFFSLLLIDSLFKLDYLNLKFIFIFTVILTSLSGFLRFAIRDILSTYNLNKNLKPKVAIYGAGEAGIKLFSSLRYSDKVNVVAFLDDSKKLQSRRINNVDIYSPENLDKLPFKVDQIFLAIPSANKLSLKNILEYLKKFSIPVFKVPSLDEITSGKVKIDNLSPITVEDLLGRELTIPNEELMRSAVNGFSVCVTGGAGSIGTELTMQILNLKPKKLIVYV